MTIKELVEAVKTHARKNYNTGGWDYVVEAYDDADIAEEIGDAKTVAEAIKNVGEICGIRNEQREDAQAEAW